MASTLDLSSLVESVVPVWTDGTIEMGSVELEDGASWWLKSAPYQRLYHENLVGLSLNKLSNAHLQATRQYESQPEGDLLLLEAVDMLPDVYPLRVFLRRARQEQASPEAKDHARLIISHLCFLLYDLYLSHGFNHNSLTEDNVWIQVSAEPMTWSYRTSTQSTAELVKIETPFCPILTDYRLARVNDLEPHWATLWPGALELGIVPSVADPLADIGPLLAQYSWLFPNSLVEALVQQRLIVPIQGLAMDPITLGRHSGEDWLFASTISPCLLSRLDTEYWYEDASVPGPENDVPGLETEAEPETVEQLWIEFRSAATELLEIPSLRTDYQVKSLIEIAVRRWDEKLEPLILEARQRFSKLTSLQKTALLRDENSIAQLLNTHLIA